MVIIDGKKIADKIKDQIVSETEKIANSALTRRPNLAIILVGEREDSKLYVSLKEKEGVKLGIDTNLYKFADSIPETELLDTIHFLNIDQTIDGILVQLPLPSKFDTDKIIQAIDPKKDADGFQPQHPSFVISPVLGSIIEILKDIDFSAQGKTACVLHNSNIFGAGVQKILEKMGLKVNLVSVKDFDKLNDAGAENKRREVKNESVKADLLVTALGQVNFVTSEMIKAGAVIIDIGITKVGHKVKGDVDFDGAKNLASYITPVPGGVGPMTIAILFRNVLEIFKHQHNF